MRAIEEAQRLHSIWVGKGPFDLDRIQASIRSEMKANRECPARSTAGSKSETHGQAILLGKIRKALKEG
jgi:hypothetical protein